MINVLIYHNPRCSKSRETLKLLRDKGIEPEVIEYLKTPPSAAQIETLLKQLGLEPLELMRTKEKTFKELGLDPKKTSRKKLVDAMAKHPILIERPIVIANGQAALGRPPENVVSIL